MICIAIRMTIIITMHKCYHPSLPVITVIINLLWFENDIYQLAIFGNYPLFLLMKYDILDYPYILYPPLLSIYHCVYIYIYTHVYILLQYISLYPLDAIILIASLYYLFMILYNHDYHIVMMIDKPLSH